MYQTIDFSLLSMLYDVEQESLITYVFDDFNRKKALTRGRNLMLSATFLVIKLGDLCPQNLIVTMPMYVTTKHTHSQL